MTALKLFGLIRETRTNQYRFPTFLCHFNYGSKNILLFFGKKLIDSFYFRQKHADKKLENKHSRPKLGQVEHFKSKPKLF